MESTEAATAIAGPSVGTVTKCKATCMFDDASPWNIDVNVLCLGETHSKLKYQDWSNNATVVDVVRLAGWRAAHQSAYVDVFLEIPVDRGSADKQGDVEIDYGDRSPYSMRRGQSLSQLSKIMFPSVPAPHGADVRGWADAVVDARYVRVHAFDARADVSLHVRDTGMRSAFYRLYDTTNDPIVADDNAVQIMWYLMGFNSACEIPLFNKKIDPPRALMTALNGAIGTDHAATWVEAHVRLLAKVRSRALRIPLAYARKLGWAVIETQSLHRLTDLVAGSTDFYLMLRMLVPYRRQRDAPRDAPRHCIVYAGGFHTDHVTNILRFLQDEEPDAEREWDGLGKVLQVSEIRTESAKLASVGCVLEALGLGPVAQAVPHTVYTPFNVPHKRARLAEQWHVGLTPGVQLPRVQPSLGLQHQWSAPVEPIRSTRVDAKRPRQDDNRSSPSAAERTDALWSLLELKKWYMSDFYRAWGLLVGGAVTLRPGTDPDDATSEDTAVNVAIHYGHPELVQYILQAPGGSGLAPYLESFFNDQALVTAALSGMMNAVVALTDDQQTGRAGAADRGCRYMVDELNKELEGDFFVPAIVAAVFNNHEDVAMYLQNTASLEDIKLASAVARLRDFHKLANDLGKSDMPTKWSELANHLGKSDMPTKWSKLANDLGKSDMPTEWSELADRMRYLGFQWTSTAKHARQGNPGDRVDVPHLPVMSMIDRLVRIEETRVPTAGAADRGAATLRPETDPDNITSEDTAVNVAIHYGHPELVPYILPAPGGSGLAPFDESFFNKEALVMAAGSGMVSAVVALTKDQQTGRSAADRGCRSTVEEKLANDLGKSDMPTEWSELADRMWYLGFEC